MMCFTIHYSDTNEAEFMAAMEIPGYSHATLIAGDRRRVYFNHTNKAQAQKVVSEALGQLYRPGRHVVMRAE